MIGPCALKLDDFDDGSADPELKLGLTMNRDIGISGRTFLSYRFY
jgi:hypothetical protein